MTVMGVTIDYTDGRAHVHGGHRMTCICGRPIVGALTTCCFWHGLVKLGRFTLEQVREMAS